MCFSRGLGILGLIDRPCTAAHRLLQRTPPLDMRHRASLWSAACASASPCDEEEPILELDACIGNPDLWTLPQRPDRIRLAFVWYIAKRGWEAFEHESAWSCVVRLDHAEERGVPLPSDFAPDVAAVIEADAKDKGSLISWLVRI